MLTHSPGPWRIGDAGHTVFGPPRGTPSPEIIAHGLTRANARIIAAAPDMLDLLACLTGYVEARIGTDGAAPSEHAKEARALLTRIAKETP